MRDKKNCDKNQTCSTTITKAVLSIYYTAKESPSIIKKKIHVNILIYYYLYAIVKTILLQYNSPLKAVKLFSEKYAYSSTQCSLFLGSKLYSTLSLKNAVADKFVN